MVRLARGFALGTGLEGVQTIEELSNVDDRGEAPFGRQPVHDKLLERREVPAQRGRGAPETVFVEGVDERHGCLDLFVWKGF